MASSGDELIVLDCDILARRPDRVAYFQRLSRRLRVPLGWHYLIDLCWFADEIEKSSPLRILDAGASVGFLQWYFASLGHTVVSVDRDSRRSLGWRFFREARISGLRPSDAPTSSWRSLLSKWSSGQPGGRVVLYQTNLRKLTEIASGSIDRVVSLSALEHNAIETIPTIVNELMRILRPGGSLLATLSGAVGEDWFHEPSQGWCFTESTLRRLFGLGQDAASNFGEYSAQFEKLKKCQFLRDHLDPVYARGGGNGMPWGMWDPKYHPIAIRKIKE